LTALCIDAEPDYFKQAYKLDYEYDKITFRLKQGAKIIQFSPHFYGRKCIIQMRSTTQQKLFTFVSIIVHSEHL